MGNLRPVRSDVVASMSPRQPGTHRGCALLKGWGWGGRGYGNYPREENLSISPAEAPHPSWKHLALARVLALLGLIAYLPLAADRSGKKSQKR